MQKVTSLTKKIYEIRIMLVTEDWGRPIEDRVLRRLFGTRQQAESARAEEVKKIERVPHWWMVYEEDQNRHPNVRIQELEVENSEGLF